MPANAKPKSALDLTLWIALGALLLLQYVVVFKTLIQIWLSDSDLSYGLLIPIIVAYLIWARREKIRAAVKEPWPIALVFIIVGCGLQVLGSLSGTLIISGFALALSLMGVVGFFYGRRCLGIVFLPLAFLIMMVPLPSYFLGQVSWYLQVAASTISGWVLGAIGVPVFQDGNLLHLPNYVLEVKQACSGSRSVFALISMALLLGLALERKWWVRLSLMLAAPVLAVAANTVRIVGTGLLAWRVGDLAANESLHEVWGLLVFVIAVGGLLAFQRFLRWATNAYA
jgi:exosortase